MTIYLVSSAHGREYLDANSVLRDWNAGLEFRVHQPTGQIEKVTKHYFKSGDTARIKFRRFTQQIEVKVK